MRSVELTLRNSINTGAVYDLFAHMAMDHGYDLDLPDITLVPERVKFRIIPLFAPGRLNWENRPGAVTVDIKPTALTYDHSSLFTPKSLVRCVARALIQFASPDNVTETRVTTPLCGGEPYKGVDRKELWID
jgi:hypothetical protein